MQNDGNLVLYQRTTPLPIFTLPPLPRPGRPPLPVVNPPITRPPNLGAGTVDAMAAVPTARPTGKRNKIPKFPYQIGPNSEIYR